MRGTPILATGGIDSSVEGANNLWVTLASTGTYAVMIFGIVALFLIRGRVRTATTATNTGETSA